MKYKLNIGWLYPDLMSIYGDRGNIICLQKRCEWREIAVTVQPITLDSSSALLARCDILFMGGAQDSQQTIVAGDLRKKKKTLKEMIENGVPGLYVCGGFQFLGKYYKEADGTVIEQLGVLDVYTENPGGKRLIGNIVVEVDSNFLKSIHTDLDSASQREKSFQPPISNLKIQLPTSNIQLRIVGFENHGGRTRLGKDFQPLGKVIAGFGSNAEDKTEGALYKNTIGTYMHGPILPKNPELADWLITKALERKYKKHIELVEINDILAIKARESLFKRLL